MLKHFAWHCLYILINFASIAGIGFLMIILTDPIFEYHRQSVAWDLNESGWLISYFYIVALFFCGFIFAISSEVLIYRRNRWLHLLAVTLLGYSTVVSIHGYMLEFYDMYIPLFIAILSLFVFANIQAIYLQEKMAYDILLGSVFLWPIYMHYLSMIYRQSYATRFIEITIILFCFLLIFPLLFSLLSYLASPKRKFSVYVGSLLLSLCFFLLSDLALVDKWLEITLSNKTQAPRMNFLVFIIILHSVISMAGRLYTYLLNKVKPHLLKRKPFTEENTIICFLLSTIQSIMQIGLWYSCITWEF